jgi:hypothetical protein
LRTHHTTTLVRRRKFRNVDGDLGRADTDSDSVDEATSDQHTDILGRTRYDGAYDPYRASNLNGATATQLVCQVSGYEGTTEGTTRHGSRDATLHRSLRSEFSSQSKSREFHLAGFRTQSMPRRQGQKVAHEVLG